jgi:predicted transcriptional regulator
MSNTENKGVVTTVRLTGNDAERLRKLAEREDRSMSSVIRLAIRASAEP